MRSRPSLATRAALAFTALAFAGCGEDGQEVTPAVSQGDPAGEGGTIVWAVADPVAKADPLQAASRAEQIATRQINEPLTAKVSAPFEPERQVSGLVRKSRSSDNDTIWTFKLRSGVRFQDSSPFNAAAVLANATRWQTTSAGNSILPDLIAADAPRPNEVRFLLSEPDPAFPKRLASPRLGIVSPRALAPASGEGAVVISSQRTGTGPFELRERGSTRSLLARHTGWWGAFARIDLGPALDQIVLSTDPSASIRLAMLDAGEAQLADELGRAQARQAEADPLLSVLKAPRETFLGVERSVRGVEAARDIPSLSGVWLTNLRTGG